VERQNYGHAACLPRELCELDPSDGDLVWISEEGGKEVRFTRDPGVGFWRRFSTGILSLFAPESLL